MRIDLLWTRWIEILAALVVATNEAWRARRALFVAFEGKRLVARLGDAPGDDKSAPPPEAISAEALKSAARRRFITLELPPDEIVLQRISVPAQAREFLSGVVRSQIERLSPWPVDQVAYGFDAQPSAADPAVLDTRVLLTSKANIETARGALALTGVSADRIVARENGAPDAAPVMLWSRFDEASGRGHERARKIIGTTALAVIGVTVSLSAWLLFSANGIRAESEDVAARSAALQRQLQPTRAQLVDPSLNPAERAWAMKETLPSGVAVLESLSRALPDEAYVTELSIQKAIVRIVGLAGDAPPLIASLEHVGQFADVHFFAPTTRGPDGNLYWFHIEARVEPGIRVGKDLP